jgi:predicted transcriptional regulator YdeE
MEPAIVSLKEKQVIGIGCRTSNSLEAVGEGQIPKLWGEFYGRQAGRSIPNKETEYILGVYTDYESDVNGMYTMIIGSEVHGRDNMPPKFMHAVLPASAYAVFTSERGHVAEVVPKAWAAAWEWFGQSGIERAYTGDFELYDEKSANPEKAVVQIYVSILA